MPTPPWLADLNDEQRVAAEAVHGPVCIIAGAGTGKTRTITHRIAHQVHSGAAVPSQILAVTFTDKAAAELRGRLHRLGLPAPVRAATFHAAAWAQLRWFWHRLDEGPLPDVLPSKMPLLIPLARRTRVEAKDLASEIEWAKARRLSPLDYAAAADGRDAPLPPQRMAAVFEEYERSKAVQGLLDYDDMLLRTTSMLESHDDIAAEVRSRYRHVTVDEFQDVNPAQFALLRAWLGDSDNVCVVGDEDQTIYSFTGATSDYLRRFERHFPGARRVTLTRNYRSTPQVLALANRVLWTKPVQARKHLATTRTDGMAPSFTAYADDAAEIAGVVRDIKTLLAAGTPVGEIAVLYRVNSQSEPLEAALGAAGIPFVVTGVGGFYDHAEVRQALRVVAAAAVKNDPAPLGLEHTTRAVERGVADRVRRALKQQMGWDGGNEPRGEAARERWRNIGVLVEIATAEAEAEPDLTLDDLVQRLQARAAGGADAAGDAGAVTLSTLHRAKGREFEAVFLVAAEEGLLPISHAKTDEAVEEERRLLYVGVTRARRHLSISWAQRRPGYSGKVVTRRPSRLLYNLGAGAPTSGGQQKPPTSKAAPARECTCGRPLVASADRRRGRCWSCFSDGASPQVAERLRAWRQKRAATDDVPAFVVFNDVTLAELARVQPRTPRDLLTVTGIGPAKVERYGEALLDLLGAE
ncbi:MAG: AAA family ATPase [Nitriliruptorales bacterium]|nr:AAA family ATPase [Nitriliruptorales bacterium]